MTHPLWPRSLHMHDCCEPPKDHTKSMSVYHALPLAMHRAQLQHAHWRLVRTRDECREPPCSRLRGVVDLGRDMVWQRDGHHRVQSRDRALRALRESSLTRKRTPAHNRHGSAASHEEPSSDRLRRRHAPVPASRSRELRVLGHVSWVGEHKLRGRHARSSAVVLAHVQKLVDLDANGRPNEI